MFPNSKSVHGVAIVAVLASCVAASPAAARNWNVGDGNWSLGTNWSPSGTPTSGEATNIVFTNGVARTVTYDFASPALGLLTIDLTGAGTTTNTLSIPNNFSLTASALLVGGYSGITSAQTSGRGAITQSNGNITIAAGGDMVLGYGAGSTGTYTLSGTGEITANQSEFIGYNGTGTFTQSTGTNTLNSSAVGNLVLGDNAGSSGTYNLSDGTLISTSNEYVGYSGTGNFVQSGGDNITSGKDLYLGFSNGSVGNYTLSNSADLTVGTDLVLGNSGTGAGTLTLQNTSSVFIANNLTINAHGTVNMSGGTLRMAGYSRASTGVFNYTAGTIDLGGNRVLNSDPTVVDLFGASPSITPGKTLAIEGQIDMNANIFVSGGTLQGLSGTLPFRIGENASPSATLSVSSGGNVTTATYVTIGGASTSGAGTLLVSGANSSFTTAQGMTIGPQGNGVMQITQGGAVSAYSALMGDQSNTSGNVLLSDMGSSWNLTTSLTVGNNGFGNLQIGTGSQVYVGTQLNINSSSSTNVILNGGTLRLNTLNDPSNKLNFTSGTLQLGGDRNFTDPIINRFYGTSPTIVSGKNLTVEGAATIDPSSSLTLNGGMLTAGRLTDNGTFNFNAGALSITQFNASTVVTGTLNINLAGASITTPITTSNTSTININADNVSLGNFGSFTGFNNQGVLNVGANAISLLSAGYAQLGSLTTLSGGTINAANGFYLSGGGNLVGSGSLNSRFTGSAGSVVEATGALALGDSTSPAGFNFDGELHTKQFVVTLNSSAPAGLGNLTTLGNGASPGTLNATNGFVVDFDDAVTGYGTINSTNTLAKHATINGTVQGTSVAQPITFSGYIKGTGTLTNVNFTGTYSPGLSPAIVTAGNLNFGSTSTLIMELGGTTPGSGYDQIQASGTLALGGTLNVSLINSFVPQLGQSFAILDWTTLGGSRSGTFSALQLPALSGGPLGWDSSQLYTSGVLSVVTTYLPGDFNRDGHVNAADILPMEQALTNLSSYKATYAPGILDPQLALIDDVNGDGKFTDADLQKLLINLKNGGGSADPVPEPSTFVLAVLAFGTMWWRFRFNVSQSQRRLVPVAMPSTR